MRAQGFEWDRDCNAPVSGRTSRARHASATGAAVAGKARAPRTRAYLVALRQAGTAGLNDEQAGQVVGCFRTSVNSIRNAMMWAGFVEETGCFDTAVFSGGRSTRRQRYRLTSAGQCFAEGL